MFRKGAIDGILFGTMAGFPFITMQAAAAAISGRPPWAPLQPFSAVLLGDRPLTSDAELWSFVIGFILHFALSAVFGAVYCGSSELLRPDLRTRWGVQLALGAAFGALLWFINLQIIARIFFASFLDSSQLVQLLLHAFTFGVPLAAMYCGAERRLFVQGAH